MCSISSSQESDTGFDFIVVYLHSHHVIESSKGRKKEIKGFNVTTHCSAPVYVRWGKDTA